MKQQVCTSALIHRQLALQIFRRTCLIVGIALFLLYFNHAIYCTWTAGGPPTLDPASWPHQAQASLAYALAAILGGIALYKGIGELPRIRKTTWILLAVCLSLIALPFIQRLILQDECLDSGGKWLGAIVECQRM